MARPRPASLADIARAAGVSAQTVSRVANGSDSVRPETAAKVREAMRTLGYRPSFAGRSLKQGRYRTVGLAMFNNITATGNMFRLDGITRAATEAGCALTLIEMDCTDHATLTSAAERLSALPVDGMIFNLTRPAENFLDFKPLAGLPMVIITNLEHPLCPTVDNDQLGCSHTIVDHLLDLGHRTVFHVAGKGESIASRLREQGWREALVARGVEPPPLLRGDWSGMSGYEAGAHLAAIPECTAIYASNDAMALGVVDALNDAGRRVPEDVSVVGVDDSLATVLPHDRITSLRFDNRAVGRWAFEHAMAEAAPQGDTPAHCLMPGTLVQRESVAPPAR